MKLYWGNKLFTLTSMGLFSLSVDPFSEGGPQCDPSGGILVRKD